MRRNAFVATMLVMLLFVQVDSIAESGDTPSPAVPPDTSQKVVAGPLQESRSNLLKQILAAKSKGVGIKAYQDAFNRLEAAVSEGQDESKIKATIDYLSSAITQQLGRQSALQRMPTRSRSPVRRFTKGTAEQQSDSESDDSVFAAAAPSEDFVYMIPGNLHTRTVSPACMQQVKSTLSGIKQSLLAELESRGGRICVAPRMENKFPNLRNTRPRGWEEGHSWKHSDGMFDGYEVIICEYMTSDQDDQEFEISKRIPGVLRHELGHAFDRYWGGISSTDEFRHIYWLELARVDPAHREGDISYYCQKSDAGASECFAELFGIITGGGCSQKVSQDVLLVSFPKSASYIKKKFGL